MRLVAWLAIDCILPLGPDFYTRMHDSIASLDLSSLTANPIFKKIADYMPGSDASKKRRRGR